MYLLLIGLIIGSIFVNSSFLTDSQILPKWVCFTIGITSMAFVLGWQLILRKHSNARKIKVMLYNVITTTIVIQAIYALCNYYNWWKQDVVFEIGSFDNPAGFSSCLCAGLPFVVLSTYAKSKWLQAMSYFCTVIVLIAIFVSKSRAGYISCSATLISIYIFKYIKEGWKKHYLAIVLIISLFIACLTMMNFQSPSKQNSMKGRKIIWNVGLNMIKDKPIFGHGLGSIEKSYMNYQSKYLQNSSSESELMLADNIKHVFNDYLAIAIQFGITGIACLIVYISLLIYCFKEKSHYFLGAQTSMSSMIGIAVFSCFSYPSYYPFTWTMIAINSYFIISPCITTMPRIFYKARSIIGLTLIVLSVLTALKVEKRLKAEIAWKKLNAKSLYLGNENILNEYQALFHNMKKDPYFLYNYAAILHREGLYSKSINISKKCERYWTDYDLIMLMAYNFKELRKYSKAIEYFSNAEAMCPNRFEPIYNIMQIYKITGNSLQAINYAKQIINKPIKIYSSDINTIRDEAQNVISTRGK